MKKVPYFEYCEYCMMFAILQRLDSASLKALFGNFAESRSKGFEEAIYENEYAEDYGYLSDSDLEDEKPLFEHASRSEFHLFIPFQPLGRTSSSTRKTRDTFGKAR